LEGEFPWNIDENIAYQIQEVDAVLYAEFLSLRRKNRGNHGHRNVLPQRLEPPDPWRDFQQHPGGSGRLDFGHHLNGI